eukprot:c44118_g1_i1 orf=207-530(+)
MKKMEDSKARCVIQEIYRDGEDPFFNLFLGPFVVLGFDPLKTSGGAGLDLLGACRGSHLGLLHPHSHLLRHCALVLRRRRGRQRRGAHDMLTCRRLHKSETDTERER